MIFLLLSPAYPGGAEEPAEGNVSGDFSGRKEVNAQLSVSSGNWPFFSRIYYLPSTLPEGFSAVEVHEPVMLDSRDQGKRKIIPETCSAEFVSGNESLKDAVEISRENDTGIFRLSLRPEKLLETGEALFRFSAEGNGLYFEKEMKLCVISWKEHPLFDPVSPELHAQVFQGEGEITEEGEEKVRYFGDNTNLYPKEKLVSMVISDRTREAADACPDDEQRSAIISSGADTYSFYEIRPGDRTGDISYPEEELWEGEITGLPFRYSPARGYQFRKSGDYTFLIIPGQSNIAIPPAEFSVLPYSVTGPAALQPGMSGKYAVTDAETESGRTFTISAEGEGFSFDPATGTLSAPESIPAGTGYTVAASPSDLQQESRLTGTVSSGLLQNEVLVPALLFDSVNMSKGFRVPVLNGPTEFHFWQGMTLANGDVECCGGTDDETAPYALEIGYNIRRLDVFAEEDAQAAERIYGGQSEYSNAENVLTETISVDGHPLRFSVMRVNGKSGPFSCGKLYYIRNDRMLNIEVCCIPQNGTAWETLPKITPEDMRKIADNIVYYSSEAPATMADGQFAIKSEEGRDVLTAGRQLSFKAVFDQPEKIAEAGYGNVVWSVTGPDGTSAPQGVSVDENGVFSADRKIDKVTQAEVRAESPVFNTSAVLPVTVCPKIRKLYTDATELFLYTGTDVSATLKAIVEPEEALADDLVWTLDKKGLINMTVKDPATVEIRPAASGSGVTNIMVSEPGGWHARIAVTVAEPVKAVTVNVRNRAKPTETVPATVEFEPKGPGNTKVEWSLDVGEDTAAIDRLGYVRIRKGVQAGTVITVICKALGAPDPVIGTATITIE